jgi:hypothetical protein
MDKLKDGTHVIQTYSTQPDARYMDYENATIDCTHHQYYDDWDEFQCECEKMSKRGENFTAFKVEKVYNIKKTISLE